MTKFREPPWGFVEILIVYIGILLIAFIFGMSGEMVKDLLNMLNIPDTILSYFYFGFIVQFTATICLVLIMTILLNQAKLSDIGINKVSTNDFIKYGIIGGLLLIVVVFTLGLPINYLKPDLEPQLYEEMLRTITSNKDFVLLFIIGAVLAPFSEELFYRGMMYPVFRRKFGPTIGMILAGIIFGLVHLDSWRAIPLAVGGIILCYIYEKTNSIFVTTMAHGVWNGLMSLFVFYTLL